MRQEEKTEITKNKIYAAAIQEFGTKGYMAGTINNICKSGINKGLIYHNFADKDALYLACVKKSCDDLLEYISENMKNISFVDYMCTRMQFFSENEWEAAIFFEARTNPPKHLEEQLERIGAEFDALNKKVFEKELDGLELRDGVSREEALNYFYEIQKLYNYNFKRHMEEKFSSQELSSYEWIKLHEENIKKILDLLLYGVAKGGR